MKNSRQFYKKAVIHNEFEEYAYPIKLEYYGTKKKAEKEERNYGIGVMKTCLKEKEVEIEQKEFNNILMNKNETEKILQILLRNKVTPIGLKDVLQDLAKV